MTLDEKQVALQKAWEASDDAFKEAERRSQAAWREYSMARSVLDTARNNRVLAARRVASFKSLIDSETN